MRWGAGFILVIGLAACGASDPAQRAERNFQICSQVISLPPERVRACSAVVADATLPAARRAEALIARGALRASEAQYARAIGDFGRALRLDPNNVQALLERAEAH